MGFGLDFTSDFCWFNPPMPRRRMDWVRKRSWRLGVWSFGGVFRQRSRQCLRLSAGPK